LNTLLLIFANNILPILLVASAGYLVQKTFALDPRSVSQIAFRIFSPALVFTLLVNADIQPRELANMMLFTLTGILLIGLISWGIARSLKLGPSMTAAFILVAMFSNSGNFGLSINNLAFGEEGLLWASLFFVTNTMLINSVGVVIASSGHLSFRDSLRGLLKVPTVYAIPLAFLVRGTIGTLPTPLSLAIGIAADATIPCMLVVLGMTIANYGVPKKISLLSASASLRLVAAPVIALLLTLPMGLSGAALQGGVTQSAMPVAVMATVIALEYKAEPEFVSGAVLATTLLSPITLTPLIAFLGG
jgi:malate permease and related proteins